MKRGTEGAELVMALVLAVIGLILTKVIWNSDLPDWFKFYLIK